MTKIHEQRKELLALMEPVVEWLHKNNMSYTLTAGTAEHILDLYDGHDVLTLLSVSQAKIIKDRYGI